MARRAFVKAVPILGPLLGTNIVPTFDDVDKLMMALALIQGLLLSCLAGGFTQKLECATKDGSNWTKNLPIEGHFNDSEPVQPWVIAISRATWSFQLLALAILFTILTYAYMVFLIQQEKESDSTQRIEIFWKSGGRIIVTVLVLLTVAGACFYAESVRWFTICMYDNTFGVDQFQGPYVSRGFLMGGLALFGAVAIHLSFRKILMADIEPGSVVAGATLLPSSDLDR